MPVYERKQEFFAVPVNSQPRSCEATPGRNSCSRSTGLRVLTWPVASRASGRGDWRPRERAWTLWTMPTYGIRFDDPQLDVDGDGPYASSQVLGKYLDVADEK